MSRVSLLVADDHPIVRTGLRKILEDEPDWQIIAEAGDGRQAVKLAVELKPDIAVLDVGMPGLNGIEATRQLSKRAPQVRVLILSMLSDEPYVIQAMQAGAKGYILKDSMDADLILAIRSVSQGRSYFSPAVAKVMLDDFVRQMRDRGITDRYDTLSEREREVFHLVAEGRVNKEIAEALRISVKTVETHRAHIMEKLDLHSAAEIILYAVRRGVIG
jgi:two-component system, NarL family, response regulator NreC